MEIGSEIFSYCFIGIGLFGIGYTIFEKQPKNNLRLLGKPVKGKIVKQERSSNTFGNSDFDNNVTSAFDIITIEFNTLKGEWIVGNIDQPNAIFYSEQYTDGEEIDVFYDEQDPYNFYVSTKQSVQKGKLLGIVISSFFLLVGIFLYLKPILKL